MMRGFIDIHHHLLYDVDDGAQNLQMSLMMAQRAYDGGTRIILATPHVTPGVEFIDEEKFRRRLEDVRAACRKDDMDLRILMGAEILYPDMTCRLLSEGRVPTLAGTEYVLVEFMPGVRFDALYKALEGILRAGFLPVVAHVERYACLASSPRRANLIKDELEGVLFQMNNSTILGGRGFFSDLHTRRLLDEGLIDITASDAHNLRERPTRMREAYEKLKEEYDGVYAGNLTGANRKGEFWRAICAAAD